MSNNSVLLDVVVQARDFLAIMDAVIPVQQKINLTLSEKCVESFSELYFVIGAEVPDTADDAYTEFDDEKFLTDVYGEVTTYLPEWERILDGCE